MGGKPKTSTPADKRLAANKGSSTPKKAAPSKKLPPWMKGKKGA